MHNCFCSSASHDREDDGRQYQKSLPGLPNITHLTLHRLDVDQPFSALLSQSPFMKDLDHLVLIRICFDTPDMFFELLSHCPRLQFLNCWGVEFSHHPDLQRHPNNHDTNDQDAVVSGLKGLKVAHSFRLLEYIAGHWGNSIPHLTTLNVIRARLKHSGKNTGCCGIELAEASAYRHTPRYL